MTPERVYLFENIPGPGTAQVYIEAFVRKQYPEMPADMQEQVASASLLEHQDIRAHPIRLATDDELKSMLPRDKWADLRLHQRALKSQLHTKCFLPEDESVLQEEVSVLMEAHGQLAAGTVAYRRETAQAVMIFALPYSILDLKTGNFSHALIATPPPARRLLKASNGLGASAAPLPAVAVDVIDSGLTIASVLVWALPPPFGPIGAGALALGQILFGVYGHDNKSPVIEAIKSAVSTLQLYVDQKVIEDKQGDLVTFQEWMSRQSVVLAEIEADPSSYIEARVLPPLTRMLEPGAGTLPKALTIFETMFNNIEPKDGESYKQKASLYNLMLATISLYLVALRMRLVLDIKLAEHYAEVGNLEKERTYSGIWFGDYADFLAIIRGDHAQFKGWPDRVEAYLPALKKSRQDLVQIDRMPEEGHSAKYLNDVNGRAVMGTQWVVDRAAGWGFVDHVTGGSQRARSDEYAHDSDCCPTKIEHKDEAESNRINYLKGVDQEFDKPAAVINHWRFAGEDWYDHRPPLAPKTTLTVSGDWSDATPQGQHWLKGNAVRYAVKFRNNKGPSDWGPYSEWVEIQDRAFPLLTDLPVDPLDMTTTILVYRCFRSEENKWTLIARLPSTQTKYRDAIL